MFTLGNTFLKFARLLNLRLPIIDPSLYIHRFAAKLELGESTHQVLFPRPFFGLVPGSTCLTLSLLHPPPPHHLSLPPPLGLHDRPPARVEDEA